MFDRARRRLAVRYVVLFVLVLAAFSAVFLGVLALALRPAFDLAPEVPDAVAGAVAYERALTAIAIALVVADILIVLVVAAVAIYLADRTLRPIREAHDRQRRFVADASHEMRTPLSTIRTTAEAALGVQPPATDAAAPGKESEALTTILGATERLSRLTNDLLLLARTQSADLEPRRAPVDLSVIVAEAVERLASQSPPPTVRVSLASDLVVHADPAELDRIVANLLDNAVRHGGGDEHPIEVATLLREGRAVVEVADRGPGIAAADLNRIFDPFYRVRADAAAPDGSGLGLAIAMDLARRNEGRLTVESGPGRGARFRLSFPRFR
ncbi:MAG: HAMP domain-containing histidine kinase [Chloroflexota bacterium]|nr:HAMP domain-containing histidine kinase [Chloroflexota bacterium]